MEEREVSDERDLEIFAISVANNPWLYIRSWSDMVAERNVTPSEDIVVVIPSPRQRNQSNEQI